MLRSRPAIKPLTLALALAFLAPISQASTQIQASASYRLDGGPLVELRDPVSGSATSGSVDVLSFPGAWAGGVGSGAGIHTYGGVSGDFGSRSSGQGDYDVTGRFVLSRTITNTASSAQQAVFNFYITPGLLQNDVRSDLSAAGRFVEAGINFDIQRDGSRIWSSQAQLRTDASGTTFSQAGTDLYAASGARSYNIAGGNYSVDLGVLDAGQSITLQYELSTFARGLAPSTGPYEQPLQTVVVPEQTVFHPEATYQVWVYDDGEYGGYGGYGGYGCNVPTANVVPMALSDAIGCGSGRWETVVREAYTEVIPERSYQVGGITVEGASGSHANSGDPFDIDWLGGVQGIYDPITGEALSAGPSPFSISLSPVPEPSTWLLMVSGLMAAGALGRVRARRQAAPLGHQG